MYYSTAIPNLFDYVSEEVVFQISMQLEESNNTLTKDVENLSKEKAELIEKLRVQEEGILKLLNVIALFYFQSVTSNIVSFSLEEYEAQKEEYTNAIKASYEKTLCTERTLKIQVKKSFSSVV